MDAEQTISSAAECGPSPQDTPTPQLAGVESIIRRYVEVPQLQDNAVTVQRTITIEKPVKKLVHQEVVREVEVERIQEVEKVVEVDEVELRVRHVPVVTRQEVPRYIDREIPGPVEIRQVEKIIEQSEIVPVEKKVYVQRPVPQDVVIDQHMPFIAQRRICPSLTVVPSPGRPADGNEGSNTQKKKVVVLRRYNPKIVPVDIPIEVSLPEILQRAGIPLTTVQHQGAPAATAAKPRMSRSPDSGIPPPPPAADCTTDYGSSVAAYGKRQPAAAAAARDDERSGRSSVAPWQKQRRGPATMRGSSTTASDRKEREEVGEDVVAVLRESVEVRPATLSVADGVTAAHYNSWLLALNDHLNGKPDIMRELPWATDASGRVTFLPEGTKLKGSLVPRALAERLGLHYPRYMPMLKTPAGHRVPADDVCRGNDGGGLLLPPVTVEGAVLLDSSCTQQGYRHPIAEYEKMQNFLEPTNWRGVTRMRGAGQVEQVSSCGATEVLAPVELFSNQSVNSVI